MRPHHYKGFTWHTVDYFDPGPDVATMTLADGSVARVVAEDGEDMHERIDAYCDAEADRLTASLEALDETVARHVAKLNAPIEELT